MEELLDKDILKLDSFLFGISPIELKRIQSCCSKWWPHTLKNTQKLAGKKWYYTFLKRYLCLSLRAPEPTSLAQAQGFNR